MKIIDGGVTAAKGFKAAGMHAGIKKGTKKDMAMVFSSTPCAAAGVFTTNLVKAAPVKWDKEIVTMGSACGIRTWRGESCCGKQRYRKRLHRSRRIWLL